MREGVFLSNFFVFEVGWSTTRWSGALEVKLGRNTSFRLREGA